MYSPSPGSVFGGKKGKEALSLPLLSKEEVQSQVVDEKELVFLECISPGLLEKGRSVALIVDVRMRRWYNVVAKHETDFEKYHDSDDPYWAYILKKSNHRGREESKCVTLEEDGLLSFVTNRIISGMMHCLHPPPSEPLLLHIPYTDLQDRVYLSGAVETCFWNGDLYVFKQILFDSMISLFDEQMAVLKDFISNPYIVSPSAYIVDEDDDMRGILFPWAGVCIDALPFVRWSYVRDLLFGLRDIHAIIRTDPNFGGEVEGSHGDVFCRNILVMDGKARWIDIGTTEVDYLGDSVAFADVLALLLDKAEGEVDRSHMEDVETWLRDGISFFDIAIAIEFWA
ncbi:hypothetical protein BU17DRAFT_59857 [Hysterangium stoloniferum]|nr:hypothetical protein BU17DRAFT_59857 [Hysterangium stoloniferum]